MARLGPTGLTQLLNDIKTWVLSKIPTKTSQLTNDSNYLTSHQSLSNYSTLANTVKSISISGKTITVTPGSGSAYTLTTQDTNTDTLVTQNVSTTNSTYPILLCATANATANQGAKTSIFGSGVKVNPNTSTITATTFSGALTGNVTGNCSGSSGSCTGNAATATQFSANTTVALTGDATGTSAGSKKGWSVPVTLANSGVTAGTYGPSADVTGNNNATISVPEITVDAKGRVTSVTNRTLTCKNNTYNVYNKTLTIQKNGTNVATFTSNSNTDVTANITVPTKVSELTNDSGFLTSHQSLSNYVTLNGAQTISGAKTFTGNVIGINKDSSTEDANSLYSTTAGSKLTYYTTTNGMTTLTNVPAAVNTTLESRTIRRLSDSDWIVEQICHNSNGLYYRKGSNGTWGAWKTFAFTDSNISGNAATATKATGNANGKELTNTIIKGLSISGKTITYTQIDGSTGTLTTQDTVYTHPTTAGNKHIPSGGSSGQFLGWASDGTAKWVNNPNTNTDTLMTQNVSTTDATYPILLTATADATANLGAKAGIFGSGVKVNPSTSIISCKGISGLPTAYNSFVNAVKDGGSLVSSLASYFGGVWSAPTKNYRVAAATFPNSGDNVYICYSVTNANVEAGTNQIAKQLTWNADSGTLTANSFSGALTGNVTGNVTGNCSGSSGSCTGNAATATTLKTARKINGVSFNGSADITVADSTKLPLAGGTLTGDLTVKGATIKFSSLDTTEGSTTYRTDTLIQSISSNTLYGLNVLFGSGGNTILGAGEGKNSLLSELAGVSNENVYVISDGNIYFQPNANTYANRKTVTLDTSANLSGLATVTATTFSGALTGNVTGNCSGTSANVTGTVAIAHGGTGATTRLGAVQALTNENVGTSTQYFLTITTSWGKAGYCSVADARTVLDCATVSTAQTIAGSKTFSMAINSSLVSTSWSAANSGTAIINSTGTAGTWTALAKMNSTNGHFTLGSYSTGFYLNYTVGTETGNKNTYSVKLLGEDGTAAFPGTVTATTPNTDDSSTKVATTAWVSKAEIKLAARKLVSKGTRTTSGTWSITKCTADTPIYIVGSIDVASGATMIGVKFTSGTYSLNDCIHKAPTTGGTLAGSYAIQLGSVASGTTVKVGINGNGTVNSISLTAYQ